MFTFSPVFPDFWDNDSLDTRDICSCKDLELEGFFPLRDRSVYFARAVDQK